MIRSAHLDFDWKTARKQERIGGLDFEVEALENLEQTIDDLFIMLEKTGNPSLLEELCPYFGQVWPSARALGDYLESAQLERSGPTSVLEVGCGLALPSLYLARTVKYSKIAASDFHPEVSAFLSRNLELNGIPKTKLAYFDLDWKKDAATLEKFHVVIGSDILYEKQHPAEVADALVRLVRSKGRIIVADPARPYLQLFVDEMKARGWRADPLVRKVSDGTGGEKDVFILDFRS